MPTGKKIFSILVLLIFLAVVIFFVLGKINPDFNIISEVLSGSVTGIVIIVFAFIILVTIIRFFRVSLGRGVE